MENVEIIISNIKKDYIDLIVYKELGVTPNKVISSHFYDEVLQKDIEFSNISSLKEYYLTSNSKTGNIFAKEVFVGDKIKNVILIMSFDKTVGDIIINFEEEEFISCSEDELKHKLKRIIIKLTEIINKYEVEEIRFGYEPASDDDMLLTSINKDGLQVNKNLKCLLSSLIVSL